MQFTPRDILYGTWPWPVPHWLHQLMQSRQAIRARNISMMVVPNALSPLGGIQNRFDHGAGTLYLALIALTHNRLSQWHAAVLSASSLEHDWGNSPFSHLSEPFLKDLLKKDGETFLANVLAGSEASDIMHTMGVTVDDVVAMVSGNLKPFSDILNGSLDIDNLDNIARSLHNTGHTKTHYNAVTIASSFRYLDGQWALSANVRNECKQWMRCRKIAYAAVYGAPHFNAAMMLLRAVQLAYSAGELSKEFFLLNDAQALEHLGSVCNPASRKLVERLQRWQWHEEIFSFEAKEASDRFKKAAGHWSERARIADAICQAYALPPEDVSVYVGVGKEQRSITVPFYDDRYRIIQKPPLPDIAPMYRAKVFLSAEHAKMGLPALIARYMENELF